MKQTPYFRYILGLICFATSGLAASYISISSQQIVFLRAWIGNLFLIALFMLLHRPLSFLQHKKDCFAVVLSGIAMGIGWLFLFQAYKYIGIGLSILINYLGPAFVILFSPVILKEHLKLSKVFALCTSIIGLILISGDAALSGLNCQGFFCALGGAVAYAVMILANKKNQCIIGLENATLQLMAAALTITVFLLLRQELTFHIPTVQLLPIFWLGIISTGIGCFFFFSSMDQISAQSVGILGYLEPLLSVFLAAIFLSERMSAIQIAGACFIIGGAVVSELLNCSI